MTISDSKDTSDTFLIRSSTSRTKTIWATGVQTEESTCVRHESSRLLPSWSLRWRRCVRACRGSSRCRCSLCWRPSSWSRWCAGCRRSAATCWRRWCATERWTSSTRWCSGSGRPWRSSPTRSASSSCASSPDARGCRPTRPTSRRGFRSWRWTGWVCRGEEPGSDLICPNKSGSVPFTGGLISSSLGR